MLKPLFFNFPMLKPFNSGMRHPSLVFIGANSWSCNQAHAFLCIIELLKDNLLGIVGLVYESRESQFHVNTKETSPDKF